MPASRVSNKQLIKKNPPFQVPNNLDVRRLLQSPIGRDARLLGGLLQLGAESAHLRLFQPGVPGRLQEDAPELLPRDGQAALLQMEVKEGAGHEQQRLERHPHEQPRQERGGQEGQQQGEW